MKYFRLYDISLNDEDGWYYCEVDNRNIIQRQVRVFGSKMYWATRDSEKDDMYMFTDKPQLDSEDFQIEYGNIEIKEEEFEEIWKQSNNPAS